MKRVSVLICFYVLLVQTVLTGPAQAAKVLKAAQINGVYRYSHNEFRILALPHHKLKVQFKGQWSSINDSRHTGHATGEAIIKGNVASFIPGDTTKCRITMTFLANRMIVEQEGSDVDCGFGANVMARGTYRRVKAGKPKFTPNKYTESQQTRLVLSASN